ncbi:MAG: MoaD/ThiS family protein [Thermodesulfobacteriota bacterium]
MTPNPSQHAVHFDPPITVWIEPDNESQEFPRLNTVQQLLNRLGLGVNAALIIRNGTLLTPDRKLQPGDHITVRLVTSQG